MMQDRKLRMRSVEDMDVAWLLNDIYKQLEEFERRFSELESKIEKGDGE